MYLKHRSTRKIINGSNEIQRTSQPQPLISIMDTLHELSDRLEASYANSSRLTRRIEEEIGSLSDHYSGIKHPSSKPFVPYICSNIGLVINVVL